MIVTWKLVDGAAAAGDRRDRHVEPPPVAFLAVFVDRADQETRVSVPGPPCRCRRRGEHHRPAAWGYPVEVGGYRRLGAAVLLDRQQGAARAAAQSWQTAGGGRRRRSGSRRWAVRCVAGGQTLGEELGALVEVDDGAGGRVRDPVGGGSGRAWWSPSAPPGHRRVFESFFGPRVTSIDWVLPSGRKRWAREGRRGGDRAVGATARATIRDFRALALLARVDEGAPAIQPPARPE